MTFLCKLFPPGLPQIVNGPDPSGILKPIIQVNVALTKDSRGRNNVISCNHSRYCVQQMAMLKLEGKDNKSCQVIIINKLSKP